MLKSEIEHEVVRPSLASGIRGLEWWAAGFGAAVGAVLMLLAHRALGDDTWITLGYVRNLAEHGHWGLLADRVSNTQTSPLNAWLLAAIFFVVGRPAVVVGLLLMATFAITGWWTARIARILGVSVVLPFLAVGLLASSPLLVSAIGMETYLGIAMMVGVARYALGGNRWAAGVLWGLAVLCRPDFVVPAGVLAALLLLPGVRTRVLRPAQAAGVGALVALPWHVWSWFHLGGFVPDSTFIKVTSPGSVTMVDAPVRFFAVLLPVPTMITAVPVVVALGCGLVAWRRRGETWARVALVFLAAGWAHWAALAAIGAFPEAWYYAPLVGFSFVSIAIVLAQARTTIGFVVASAFGAACLAASGPTPWSVMPLVLNHAETGQYQQVGAEVRALTGGQQVLAPGEIGVLSYFSDGLIVDHFGDPALTKVLLDKRYAEAGTLEKAVLGWNWRHFPEAPMPHFDYVLAFKRIAPDLPGQVLRTWQVGTPARGQDELVLLKLN
ncbi:hypothetical protein [Saccharopolyspora tripterygii]